MATTIAAQRVAPASVARTARPAQKAAAFGRINGLTTQIRPAQPFAAPVAPRNAQPVAMAAVPQEVAQVALEAGFIWTTAGICFAMTLVGVAVGFVLLRVESLVEEGKI